MFTPCELKGYEEGDLFIVLTYTERKDCFTAGSIIELISDDHSQCPKFKLIGGVNSCADFSLSEDTAFANINTLEKL